MTRTDLAVSAVEVGFAARPMNEMALRLALYSAAARSEVQNYYSLILAKPCDCTGSRMTLGRHDLPDVTRA
jgi:hypothetical protein